MSHCIVIPLKLDLILRLQDGLNGQALSATVFIYFACLSGAIAFGGLLGEKTRELIGIPETIIVSCVAGTEDVQSTRPFPYLLLYV